MKKTFTKTEMMSMGDPRGKIKAARRAMLKGEGPQGEKRRGKRPLEKKPAVRNIIRVAGTDLDGNKQLPIALKKIRGVGYNFARAIVKAAGFDHKKKLAELDEKEIKKIEQVIQDPVKAGIPAWLVNRQKDLASGKNIHVTGPELPLSIRADIELMRKIRAYKGIRHEMGLTVRGQRTRTAGRKGVRVGVVRKKVMPAKAEKKEKKK